MFSHLLNCFTVVPIKELMTDLEPDNESNRAYYQHC